MQTADFAGWSDSNIGVLGQFVIWETLPNLASRPSPALSCPVIRVSDPPSAHLTPSKAGDLMAQRMFPE
jgi:hypothetical protein